ncbi:isoprenylcysteine carboxylmethyltransferase family protein [Herbiconiux sp.]|uniref:methyltransferase family protein n=1 Tax=Herbiconiux sp. TaxID=1871186 RepID=UPI0025C383C4|nr:isoprenylcysteine carboxylmethyltransferase family protein [Herbiconiux sp.]
MRRGWGRAYFAAQAVAGLGWWVAVFTVPRVRESTLGGLDPVAMAVADVPLFVVASGLAAAGIRVAAVVATAWTAVVAVGLAVFATVTSEAGWGVLLMTTALGCSLVALCLLLLGRVPTRWLVAGPFAFRPAAHRTGVRGHVLTTFAQVVVFWGVCLLVIPLVLAWLEQRWRVSLPSSEPAEAVAAVLGAALLVLASTLGLWSAVTMSTRGDGTPLPAAMPNRLVIAGPYRFIRNPMALAGITQGVGVGLLLGSWLVVVYAVAGSLLWNYAIRPLEEADLEGRFGEEFRRYREDVRCWLPGRSGGATRRRLSGRRRLR